MKIENRVWEQFGKILIIQKTPNSEVKIGFYS